MAHDRSSVDGQPATQPSAPSWKSSGSSRLCVKNVPKYVDEKRLREHFSQQGEVTDVKLLRTKSGRSRQLAFVGYRTEKSAKRAVKFFHKSYIDTSRLSVEIALPVGDSNLKRPWSKHSKQISAEDEAGVDVASGRQPEPKTKRAMDKKLQEFMSLMQPRWKSQFWSNDFGAAEGAANAEEAVAPQESGGVAPSGGEDGAEEEEEDDDDEGHSESDDEAEGEEEEVEGNGVSSSPSTNAMDDMAFLRSKMTDAFSDDEEDGDDSTAGVGGGKGGGDASSAMAGDDRVDLADTGRLFVRNLPFNTTEDELREAFGRFGAVSEAHLPLDSSSRSKGYGYVSFMVPEDAVGALATMNGAIFQGRLLHVLPSNPRRGKDDDEDESGEGGSSFKRKQDADRRAKASDEVNWNALFVRSDAAVSAISRQLGVAKGEMLDATEAGSDSLAVRVAVAETNVVAEAKRFLVEEGVDLTALEAALNPGAAKRDSVVKRSGFVLLVKNLPHDSDAAELTQMFARHGKLERFVMPDTRTMALVAFVEPKDAKKAFKALAYRRYKRVPLYLEWAPEGTLQRGTPASEKSVSTADADGDDVDTDADAAAAAPERADANTLFVKNLNFDTREPALRTHFDSLLGKGAVRHVTIPRKRAGAKDSIGQKRRRDDDGLSLGFGFVEFSSEKLARRALRQHQGAEVDGHALELKYSARPETKVPNAAPSGDRRKARVGGNDVAAKAEASACTKIAVRNVAFEASRKEIRKLFEAYGKVKSVRMPKKFDGTHRGFAFVDFLTHQEAKSAFAALASTHLYGRHLVLEWALDDDSIEAKREKAAKDLASGASKRAEEAARKRIKTSSKNEFDTSFNE